MFHLRYSRITASTPGIQYHSNGKVKIDLKPALGNDKCGVAIRVYQLFHVSNVSFLMESALADTSQRTPEHRSYASCLSHLFHAGVWRNAVQGRLQIPYSHRCGHAYSCAWRRCGNIPLAVHESYSCLSCV